MLYLEEAVGSALLPKIVGSYELEVVPWLERIQARRITTIVDVGCAEGYYAVGLARANPEVRVVAYDTDPFARKLCRRLARLNGVDSRVAVRGAASPATLQADVDPGRTLVISDCEGFEMVLLDPVLAPALRKADMLVELHEYIAPGCGALLKERFSGSHRIEERVAARRRPSDFPLPGLSESETQASIEEGRPAHQSWLYLTLVGTHG